MSYDHLLLFSSLVFLATITPGPAIMLIMTNAAKYGAARATISILGNISGLFVMSLLSILGLSTIMLYSENVFWAVKIVGACYLLFLGYKLWRYGFKTKQSMTLEKRDPRFLSLYAQGLLIAVTNPKVIALTSALFPQFIHTEQALAPQFFVLTFIFMALSFASLSVFALVSARTKERVGGGIEKIISRLFGAAFVGSGIGLISFTR